MQTRLLRRITGSGTAPRSTSSSSGQVNWSMGFPLHEIGFGDTKLLEHCVIDARLQLVFRSVWQLLAADPPGLPRPTPSSTARTIWGYAGAPRAPPPHGGQVVRSLCDRALLPEGGFRCCVRIHPFLPTSQSSITSTSIFVRRQQSSASSGLHTTGSFSLNEVFSTIGTPVSPAKASINR